MAVLVYAPPPVRHTIAPWLAVATLLVAMMAACGGRTLNASPADDDGSGGSGADDGSGGSGGLSGVGGSGAMSSVGGNGQGAGGSGPGPGPTSSSGGPLDCFQCLGDNCPDAIACFTDPTCMQGMICSVTTCLSGGQPDLMCVFDCFNGDIGAALEALQVIQCVFGSCQEECGSLLPFPGP
jgi:hypothetical protein